jgi:hypothetical protein
MKYSKANEEDIEENDSASNISDDGSSDNYNEFKPKKEKKGSNRNIGSITKALLENVKQALPTKRNKKKEKLEKENQELNKKRKEKRKQRKYGYVPELNHWSNKEKLYKKIATKGVVKLFNAIYDIKKKVIEEHKTEAIVKEKKSRNFLMMHDLAPKQTPNVSKSFKEDN